MRSGEEEVAEEEEESNAGRTGALHGRGAEAVAELDEDGDIVECG